jgi:hypothetical protein
MPTNNKYGSLTETFMGTDLINIQLNAKAVPPSDLNLASADFAESAMYASVVASAKLGKFALGETPRITGVGIWCNIADGLVQIDNPDDDDNGLVLRILAKSYNSGDALVQANVTVPAYSYKVQEFNQIYDVDYQMDMSPLDYTLTGQPTIPQVNGGYFRLFTVLNATTSKFSTISVDPLFATKRLIMRPMLVVEHTFPLFIVGF